MSQKTPSPIAKCGFCGRPRNEVKKLVGASDFGPFICNRCLKDSWMAIQVAEASSAKAEEPSLRKPVEIKRLLDQHVIAQDKAKCDLAIAVYNHYKRRDALRNGNDLDGIEIAKSNILLMGPSGCHRRGQLILMYDGSIKAVEDVRVGDCVMGPDSTPRNVLELHTGTEEMVEIVPNKGAPWVVNKGHILTVFEYDKGLVDVPLREWQDWSEKRRTASKLVRVGVDFPLSEKALPIEPYFLGVLLGDGSLAPHVRVTSADSEIVAAVRACAQDFGLQVNSYAKATTSARDYVLAGTKGKRNPVAEALDSLGLWGSRSENKFIPQSYLTASREDRLALLAGLIDTDGCYRDKSLCFDFTSKSEKLAQGVAFLARSLGFAAYSQPFMKDGTTYFQMNISGDIDTIPVKVGRKKARARHENGRDVLRTGFSTRELPPEEYFGFVLDGDHRYLLDDFTVTHNTGKTELARSIAKMLNVPFYVGDATRLTQAGYVGDDVESLLQGLIQAADGDIERAQWGVIFLDEVDKLARKSGRGATGFRDVTGEGVQQALLKLLEGSKVVVPRGMNAKAVVAGGGGADVIDTGNILFIGAGSFAGIEEIIGQRLNKGSGIGFGKDTAKKLDNSTIYKAVTEDDVLEFGLIPEIMGRLPILTTTIDLTDDEMVRILTEPKNAIIKQFQALFSMDNVDLQFDEGALKAIGREAKKRPTGARALRSIVESILRPYSFDTPTDSTIEAIRITEAVVTEGAPALIVRRSAQSVG
jgi:endopeptidase Clp ATP-binding regulatory subunit ClpX